MDDDRQLAELHQREQYASREWLERKLQKMERDVEHGNALRKILRSERERQEVKDNEGSQYHSVG